MGTHVLHAVGDLPFQRLPGALFDVLMGQQCLALRPALNAFKQGAGLVPGRLSGGLGGVQMDMRLDKRRQRQPTLRIKHVAAPFLPLRLRHQMGNAPLLNGQLPQPFMPAQTQVVDKLQWTLGHPSPLLLRLVLFIILAEDPADKAAKSLLLPPLLPKE
ncbi:hypothetical protein D3C79_415190 [compost metagenome]